MNLEEAKANIGKQFNYTNKSGEMIYSNMTLRSVKHTGGSGLANISYEPNDNSVFTVGVEGLELSEQGMNLEEAKANIGKEVIYIGNDQEVISAFNGKKLIISYPTKNTKTSVLIEYDELCFWNVDPQDLKLKDKPMQNYKIKVTPETSEEVQELFFELGYSWVNGNEVYRYPNMKFIYVEDGLIFYRTTHEDVDFEYQEITLPQLRDLVVLKRNDVGDATHVQKNYESNKYYVGDSVYNFDGIWVKTIINKVDILGCLKPIINNNSEMKVKELNKFVHLKSKEMNFRDALIAINNGEEVEFLRDGDWFSFVECAFENYKFRIKPKTIHIDGGDYTKEELLKIVGEMG